ncbi:30S ribosomal protein S16 [Rhodocaloribacter litoris]|uniref:30S ribosomal protein S16 n=1 Tax=Rhodocaloribacter litoris TaxID=2558931 RepID=UPI0014215A27|nr:30S ribosomal protein S16 [Rhodocaloribacter litoris]
MAVKLRLRRMGRKKRPIYAVVAADVRSPRDGRFIEDLGRYRPLTEPATVELRDERVLYWLERGAQPTETVRSLLSRQGLLLALHLKRKGVAEEEIWQAVEAHRTERAEKDRQRVKLTPQERRRQALEAERKAVEAREAEEARKRAEAEARAKAEAEEARRKAAEERARAAAEAQAAQEAANRAQAEADAAEAQAETPVEAEAGETAEASTEPAAAPGAETETGAEPKAETGAEADAGEAEKKD